MKYRIEIEIERRIDDVISLFNNTENLRKWMDRLESFETISGTQREIGARSNLFFRMG